MGRPRTSPDKPTPPPTVGPDSRVVIAHIKGSPEYAEWLESVHRATHIPKAALFRLAVKEWAARNGHGEPPEL